MKCQYLYKRNSMTARKQTTNKCWVVFYKIEQISCNRRMVTFF